MTLEMTLCMLCVNDLAHQWGMTHDSSGGRVTPKGKQYTQQVWPPCLVGEGKAEEPLLGLPTPQPFQRDLPPGYLHALPLSLLTQDFCICYSLCLSELSSPETSTAPLWLSIHFWLPKGNFSCPPDHNHSPTYAIIASFYCGTFHGEMLYVLTSFFN